ncbi:MAG: hypothetical protein KGP35_00840 [Bacteroidetes bacterium]|nr:hypothetical protein [Bacteroidota bacterium]
MQIKDELGYKKRSRKKSRRPLDLSIVCVIVVLLGFYSIIDMFMHVYERVYTLYPALNALVVVFSFVSLSGIWSMEKWGPISFPFVVVLKLLIDLIFGKFVVWYLLGLVLAIYFLRFLPKMRNSE